MASTTPATARTRPTPTTAARRLVEPVASGCDTLRQAEPHATGATYWFDAEPAGSPYPVTIRFFARRLGGRGKHGTRDERTQYERIERVLPGSGRISVTTRFEVPTPGEWEILAAPADNPREPGLPSGWANPRPLRLPRGSAVAQTSFAPLVKARAPGVHFGVWPALVLTGLGIALALQEWLARRAGLAAGGILAVSAAASILGLLGAKAWYLILHRERPASVLSAVTAGMCIQGFVVTAGGALALAATLAGQPVGTVVDATAPGLLYAMAVGRVGCWFAGCCAGRGTASAWGLWSSDRRIGMRRVPVQLIESALAASLATVTLLAVLTGRAHPGGAIGLIGVGAYTGLRQLLFPLRAERRQTRHGRLASMTVALVAVATLLAVAATHPKPMG